MPALVDIEKFLPTSKIEEVCSKIVGENLKGLIQESPDPNLVQIAGYSHVMKDPDTHMLVKQNLEPGETFEPIEISYIDLKAREYEFQYLMLDRATCFLKEQHGINFNKITKLVIQSVDEQGIGFEQLWRGNGDRFWLYLPGSRLKWKDEDYHLYITWEVQYTLSEKRSSSEDDNKLPMAVKEEETSNKESSSPRVEVKKTRRENGETVLFLPKDCLKKENITAEIAKEYLAVMSLSGLSLTPYLEEEEKNNYIDNSGVVLWNKNPQFKLKVDTPFDIMSDKAKNSIEQQTQATMNKLKDMKEQTKQMYLQYVNDAKGKFAAEKEKLKLDFEEWKADLKELSEITGNYSKDLVKAASATIVTTPTGPGVAINATIIQMDNLRTSATSMKTIISKIEVSMKKMKLETYASSVIPGLQPIVLAAKNLISLAKTAIALVGG